MDYKLQLNGKTLSIVPDDALEYNKKYIITVEAGLTGTTDLTGAYLTLASDYQFWFTSKYCPLFTTLDRVRLEAGPPADSLIDDTIFRMIHKNSIDVVDLINTTQRSTTGTSIAYDFWGCDWQLVPYELRRYVECKTAYDILALIELVNNSDTNQLKTLGDMTIRYGGPGSAANAAVDEAVKTWVAKEN